MRLWQSALPTNPNKNIVEKNSGDNVLVALTGELLGTAKLSWCKALSCTLGNVSWTVL